MHKAILVAMACAFAAACTSTSETATVSSAASDVRCVKQAPTGSHITRNECRTAEQREQDRKEADEFVRRQRALAPPAPTPGGN